MGRVYSKHGCLDCKKRRKKCDEIKPTCSACKRLRLQCVYPQQVGTATQDLAPQDGMNMAPAETTAAAISRAPAYISFQNDFEYECCKQALVATLACLSMLANDECQDLSMLWDMTYHDELTRNAVVACFSIMYGTTAEHDRLGLVRYGMALRSLRTRLSDVDSIGRAGYLSVLVSITVLALLDSIQPSSSDLFRHAVAAMRIMVSTRPRFRSVTVAERSVIMFCLETITYNVTNLGVYSPTISNLKDLLAKSRILKTLATLIPAQSSRLGLSPILDGQYEVHELVLTVSELYRSRKCVKLEPLWDSLTRARASVLSDFATLDTASRSTLVRVYSIILNSIEICLLSLDPESCRASFDRAVADSLGRFLTLPSSKFNRTVMWGLTVLACAIEDELDWDAYRTKLQEYTRSIDPGHKNRIEDVVKVLQQLRDEGKFPSGNLPGGLALLTRPMHV